MNFCRLLAPAAAFHFSLPSFPLFFFFFSLHPLFRSSTFLFAFASVAREKKNVSILQTPFFLICQKEREKFQGIFRGFELKTVDKWERNCSLIRWLARLLARLLARSLVRSLVCLFVRLFVCWALLIIWLLVFFVCCLEYIGKCLFYTPFTCTCQLPNWFLVYLIIRFYCFFSLPFFRSPFSLSLHIRFPFFSFLLNVPLSNVPLSKEPLSNYVIYPRIQWKANIFHKSRIEKSASAIFRRSWQHLGFP